MQGIEVHGDTGHDTNRSAIGQAEQGFLDQHVAGDGWREFVQRDATDGDGQSLAAGIA